MTFSTLRWILLLAVSYLTIFWISSYAVVALLLISVLTYIFGLLLRWKKDRFWLFAFITCVSTPLILSRVYFVNLHLELNLLGLIGLSFYTLKSLSYLIDVYHRKIPSERNFVYLALYLAFLPQLFAGPIDRPANFITQMRNPIKLTGGRFYEGSIRILWGLFLKIVIADRVAVIVNAIFLHPQDFIGLPLILGMTLFSIQIYTDFSGYSNISIGTSRILGIDSAENFNKPYLSKTVQEFWTRWHISLSSWLKDYIYIPLGGSRNGFGIQTVSVFATFLLSGLWHGVGVTFLVWGLLHGLILIATNLFRIIGLEFKKDNDWKTLWQLISRIYGWFAIPITFSIITILWTFFRATSLSDALYITTHFYRGIGAVLRLLTSLKWQDLWNLFFVPNYEISEDIFISTIFALLLYAILSKLSTDMEKSYLRNLPVIQRWSFYYVVLFSIAFTLFFYDQNTVRFIYSRF
jgi:D-alanyl-lipoteichoic acid acyltransferase DltB (MBOAT superfamily)